jgi:hypothetical protein
VHGSRVPKVRRKQQRSLNGNIRRDSRVVLSFDTDAVGSTVEVIHAMAQGVDEAMFAPAREAYVAKYSPRLQAIGSNPRQMLTDYDVTIFAKPQRLRG